MAKETAPIAAEPIQIDAQLKALSERSKSASGSPRQSVAKNETGVAMKKMPPIPLRRLACDGVRDCSSSATKTRTIGGARVEHSAPSQRERLC